MNEFLLEERIKFLITLFYSIDILISKMGGPWLEAGQYYSTTGYLKVKSLTRCVLCHSLFECDDTVLGAAGNCHHNCMIIPHSSL